MFLATVVVLTDLDGLLLGDMQATVSAADHGIDLLCRSITGYGFTLEPVSDHADQQPDHQSDNEYAYQCHALPIQVESLFFNTTPVCAGYKS